MYIGTCTVYKRYYYLAPPQNLSRKQNKAILMLCKPLLSFMSELKAFIKTHGSESRGQGGSSKWRPDGLETHTREYFTGTRVVKFENAITEEP